MSALNWRGKWLPVRVARAILKLQSRVWASRGERFLRGATGSVLAEDANRLLAGARVSRWAPRGGFPNIGMPDTGNEPPTAHALVALHRPVLSDAGSVWLHLIRFSLAATPDDALIILRPHPNERGCPVHDELIAPMRSRGVRVSRPGQGGNLAACRTWGVESENQPQRGQFLPGLQAHSSAMGQKDGEKWGAAAELQPTNPKSDRLLATLPELRCNKPHMAHTHGHALQGRIGPGAQAISRAHHAAILACVCSPSRRALWPHRNFLRKRFSC